MLAGWVTFDELRILSGLNKAVLKQMITYGVRKRCLHRLLTNTLNERRPGMENYLYNLADFEKCLSLFLY